MLTEYYKDAPRTIYTIKKNNTKLGFHDEDDDEPCPAETKLPAWTDEHIYQLVAVWGYTKVIVAEALGYKSPSSVTRRTLIYTTAKKLPTHKAPAIISHPPLREVMDHGIS